MLISSNILLGYMLIGNERATLMLLDVKVLPACMHKLVIDKYKTFTKDVDTSSSNTVTSSSNQYYLVQHLQAIT